VTASARRRAMCKVCNYSELYGTEIPGLFKHLPVLPTPGSHEVCSDCSSEQIGSPPGTCVFFPTIRRPFCPCDMCAKHPATAYLIVTGEQRRRGKTGDAVCVTCKETAARYGEKALQRLPNLAADVLLCGMYTNALGLELGPHGF